MRRFVKKRLKAFTLVELLVVISIIGIIATLVVVFLNSARGKGRDIKRVANLKQICTALELFYADNGFYPYVGCSYTDQSVNQHYGVFRDEPDDNNSVFDILQPYLSPEYMLDVPNDTSAAEDGNWSYFYDNYYDSAEPDYTPERRSCDNQGFQLLGYLEDVNVVDAPADFPWGTWQGRGWWRACKSW